MNAGSGRPDVCGARAGSAGGGWARELVGCFAGDVFLGASLRFRRLWGRGYLGWVGHDLVGGIFGGARARARTERAERTERASRGGAAGVSGVCNVGVGAVGVQLEPGVCVV